MNNSNQQTALIWASIRGHLDVFNRLLDCKEIDVNLQDKYGDTALMNASQNGHLDVVNRLLDYNSKNNAFGIDVNSQNKVRDTALIHASKEGYLDVVNRLLECKNIDVNLKDMNGCTALIEASKRGHLDVVNRLEDYHKNQIQEGFDLVNDYERKFNTLYICTDIVELVIDFTV